MNENTGKIDRLLTLGFFEKFRNPLGNSAKDEIPILMYHSISNDREPGMGPYFKVNTSLEVFRSHLEYLKTNGYTTVYPEDLQGILDSGTRGPEKHVIITFDDGYRDFYTAGYPILSEFGFSSTVYLPSDFINKKNFHQG